MGQLSTASTEYEMIYVLRTDATREASEGIANRVKDTIGEFGAVTAIENWGRRKLAYKVQKQSRGVYVYFKYVAKGGVVAPVERLLRLNEAVMKFQTVKLDGNVETEAAAADASFEYVEEFEAEEEESFAKSLGLESVPERPRAQEETEAAPAADGASAEEGATAASDAAPEAAEGAAEAAEPSKAAEPAKEEEK